MPNNDGATGAPGMTADVLLNLLQSFILAARQSGQDPPEIVIDDCQNLDEGPLRHAGYDVANNKVVLW